MVSQGVCKCEADVPALTTADTSRVQNLTVSGHVGDPSSSIHSLPGSRRHCSPGNGSEAQRLALLALSAFARVMGCSRLVGLACRHSNLSAPPRGACLHTWFPLFSSGLSLEGHLRQRSPVAAIRPRFGPLPNALFGRALGWAHEPKCETLSSQAYKVNRMLDEHLR
jgi:hypothetical protein